MEGRGTGACRPRRTLSYYHNVNAGEYCFPLHFSKVVIKYELLSGKAFRANRHDAGCISDQVMQVLLLCTRGRSFAEGLSEEYADDYILLICDGVAWHKSTGLIVPENIELFFIPPYTPEMNPIEQIWKEIRRRGFQNEIFNSL